MGRANILPENINAPIKLRLERLNMVDGDYDQGGAYWGHSYGGSEMFCAWNDSGVRVFIRDWNREAAKQGVLKCLPKAKFYR